MTNDEKKKLSVEEQIKALESTSYMKYPSQELRDADRPAPNSGTSSVTPSAPKQLTPATAGGIDTCTSMGRSNPHPPTGFMLPRVPGANAPSPSQTSGSNLPGSSIPQLPPVTLQEPGMVFSQNAEPTEPKTNAGRGNPLSGDTQIKEPVEPPKSGIAKGVS